MEIALMRSKISIQKCSVTSDALGNHIESWELYYDCSAYANMSSGREYEAAGHTVSSDTIVFTIRYCALTKALNTKEYRIIFDGDIYNITAIDDYQYRHETLKITGERKER